LAQKKTSVLKKEQRKDLLDREDKLLSIRKQCELLSINRSSLYYVPEPESPFNLELADLINAEFTIHPNKGVGQMTTYLRRAHAVVCNPKRVRRLMRMLGLEV